MRHFLMLLLFIGYVGDVYASPIHYQSEIYFEDAITGQLDRIYAGGTYERVSRSGGFDTGEFWRECDDSIGIGSSAYCANNSHSYSLENDISVGGNWQTLGWNFHPDTDRLDVDTSTEVFGGSSLTGSFGLFLTEEMINEALAGQYHGIRLSLGFSWLGFGAIDSFEGVTGYWTTQLNGLQQDTLPGLSLMSSLNAHIQASSVDTSLGLVEGPKTITNQLIEGTGGGSSVFSPDLASYGFDQGDIVSFSARFETRLWLEEEAHAVPEPNSLALIGFGLIGFIVIRSKAMV